MTKKILIHIDGAAKGNPGPAAIGLVGHTPEGTLLFQNALYIGETTNNVAEYTALIEALQLALKHGAQEVRVASDSQLVVRQIQGTYQVKKPHLKELYARATALIRRFKHVEVFHIPREENAEADSLANLAIKQHYRLRQS